MDRGLLSNYYITCSLYVIAGVWEKLIVFGKIEGIREEAAVVHINV
jgi:hypothetical protein